MSNRFHPLLELLLLLCLLLLSPARFASAQSVGICLTALGSGGSGNVGTVSYASTSGLGSCTAGFAASVTGVGSTSPGSLAPGLTSATLGASGTSSGPDSGTGVAQTTASLDRGSLGLFADASQHTGFQGVQATSTSNLFDVVTFHLAPPLVSAQVSLVAHLNALRTSPPGGGSSFGLSTVLNAGAGGFAWSSNPSGFGPNPGATGTFTNQSASGFDWQSTIEVADGQTLAISFQAQANANTGWVVDGGANAARLSLFVPNGVSFTSSSAAFLTAVPEPDGMSLVGAGFVGLSVLASARGARRSLQPPPIATTHSA